MTERGDALFPNALLIARREYVQRVRTRAFGLSTVVLAFVAVAVGLSPIAVRALDREAVTRISIHVTAPDLRVDPVAATNTVLNAGALSAGDVGRRSYGVTLATDLDKARAAVRDGRSSGVLIVGRAADGRLTFQFAADVSPAGRLATIVKLAAVWLAIQDGLERAGLGPSTGEGPYERFDVVPVKPATGGPPPGEIQSFGQSLVATILIILIFITVMTYGMWIAVSVAEEKNSRVMELMLGAATPAQLLAGKVAGVGAAGLTQYGVIVGTAVAALGVQRPVEALLLGDRATEGGPFSGLTVGVLAAFLCFFVLGFTLYALLYAAAGSLVSRQEDTQQVAMPMIVLAMIGYFAASIALQSMEAAWVAPLSYVPFFAPYLMVGRITMGRVEPWEVGLSIALLVGTIAVATWAAARIYRAGVLLYGQRPGLRTFVAAVRTPR